MDYNGNEDVPPYEVPREALLRARFELYKQFFIKAKDVKEMLDNQHPDVANKLRQQIDGVLLKYGHPPEKKVKKKNTKKKITE